ncbi:ATP-binding protein [Massilia niastensis]|uniref:ATP-binding protein n=1 Tax=Massilia niastensis TaxID=544911 RepID=UPI00047759AD|nr:ATP-binding protein [Massilia niastensis]
MSAFLSRLWPDSLFARLALILFAGLAVAHTLSFTLTVTERNRATMDVMMGYIHREVISSVALLDLLPAEERPQWLPRLARNSYRFILGPGESGGTPDAELSRRAAASISEAIGRDYPLSVNAVPGERERLQVHLNLSDGTPLTIDLMPMRGLPLSNWLPYVLGAQLAILLACCWLAVRVATRPLRTLADAADALGPDLRPVAVSEEGPSEVRRAARAFNAMQRRIAAYIDERIRILGAISHDLQTPITRMRLRVDLMDDDNSQDRLREDLLELEDMAKEGLQYARAMHGEREAACVVDLDNQLDSLVLDYTDCGAAVVLAGRAGAPLRTRPKALRRILNNLAGNALKFAGYAELVVARNADGGVVIRVLDRGPGIPEDMLEAVFEPFFRLESSRNRATGGSGLGLAIARQLAVSIGATLTLHRRSEGGLEARLVLPAVCP